MLRVGIGIFFQIAKVAWLFFGLTIPAVYFNGLGFDDYWQGLVTVSFLGFWPLILAVSFYIALNVPEDGR